MAREVFSIPFHAGLANRNAMAAQAFASIWNGRLSRPPVQDRKGDIKNRELWSFPFGPLIP
jgi:hypothetical protein